MIFMKFYNCLGRTKKNEKLGTDFSHTQNVSIVTGPMSNDVFFYRAGGLSTIFKMNCQIFCQN